MDKQRLGGSPVRASGCWEGFLPRDGAGVRGSRCRAALSLRRAQEVGEGSQSWQLVVLLTAQEARGFLLLRALR